MNLIIGVIIVVGCIFGGYAAMGGHLLTLWQPWEVVMICGGALGAFIIANSMKTVIDSGKAIFSLFKKAPHGKDDYLELLSLIYAILRTARSKGLNSMESDLDEPQNSEFFKKFKGISGNPRGLRFLCDYLRLIQLGSTNAHELEALMDEEIETLTHELYETPKALNGMSESLPALGIVAAVMGVVKAMGKINAPPEVLGGLIGGAMVGTFLGILLSYCFVGPIASAVKARRSAEIGYFTCIKAGLLAHLNGYAPPISVEFARKVLTSDIQPDFFAVEKATSEIARQMPTS